MDQKLKLPLRIAIFHNILWSKYKGGVFSAIHRISSEHGVAVSFCQIAETEGERVALGGVDLNYHRYPFELLFKGAYHATPLSQRICSLVAQAWKTTADIVILPGYERPEYWAMLAVLILRRKPRAVFCDSTAFDRPRSVLKSLAKRLFFSRCDGFFGYGIRSKEYLLGYGVPAQKIFFRCQAAALPMDYSEDKAIESRLKFAPRDPSAPRFLYVGRLSQEKGLYTLLKAMRTVCTECPRAILVLVGAGPMKENLIARVEDLDLGDSVTFTGSMNVHQLARQYAEATALVLPSTSEPWGLVVNESLSMGCPVVVSDRCGCVPELVVTAKTGYAFTAGDADELARRMMVLATEMTDIEKVTIQCIEHIRAYSPVAAATQIIHGCRSILSLAGKT